MTQITSGRYRLQDQGAVKSIDHSKRGENEIFELAKNSFELVVNFKKVIFNVLLLTKRIYVILSQLI